MIKNFIYLDEEKMYSLSSQIFEGVTEFVIKEQSTESQEKESQEGVFFSGRKLSDILHSIDKQTEKKVLSDFSYNVFEQKLLDECKVIDINEISVINDLNTAMHKSFVKVTSKIIFNDMRILKQTLKNFNKFGLALTYLTNFNQISEINTIADNARAATKDRNHKSKLSSFQKSISSEVENLAKSLGFQHDQKFLDNLEFLLDYGFQDQLEIQMNLADFMMLANLKRNYLRESEELIIKKYSRCTESYFVIFGILTQYKNKISSDASELDNSSIREAVMNMLSSLTKVEETFIGRLDNEVIIDPIAIYTEL